jgi:hypothetical protein
VAPPLLPSKSFIVVPMCPLQAPRGHTAAVAAWSWDLACGVGVGGVLNRDYVPYRYVARDLGTVWH